MAGIKICQIFSAVHNKADWRISSFAIRLKDSTQRSLRIFTLKAQKATGTTQTIHSNLCSFVKLLPSHLWGG